MTSLTANASKSVKNRIHEVRLGATAGEQLTANFRGALNAGETLTAALWESDYSGVAGLVSGEVDEYASRVVINCPTYGSTYLRCQVTTTSGRTLNQVFRIVVQGGVFPDGAPAGGNSLVLAVPGGG
jgi:hypothetical protein